MKLGSANHPDELHAALLDSHRAGSRPTDAGPRLALSRVTEVLQIASGRLPGAATGTRAASELEDAARFFIRSVLLRPGADHYALLGLERTADTAAIKEHYRLMMRLLHPDFAAAAPTPWPADAASRVNLAYQVLSAPAQRREYDQRLAPPSPPRSARPPTRGIAVRTEATTPASHPRRRLKQLALVFGGFGALAGLAGLLAGGPTESLVQRTGAASASLAIAKAPLAETNALPQARAPQVAITVPSAAAASPPPARVPLEASALPERTAAAAAAAPAPTSAPAPQAIAVVAAPSEPVPALPAAPPPAASPKAAPPPTQAASAAGPTLAEVHPMFSVLLQQIESGWSDRIVDMLDRPARAAPATQALLARYNAIVEDRRPVRLSGIAFSSQARSGHLVVSGRVLIAARDERRGLPPGELTLEAEFASRDGRVVMTRLAPASE